MKNTAKIAKDRLQRILHDDRMATGRGHVVPLPNGQWFGMVIQKVRR